MPITLFHPTHGTMSGRGMTVQDNPPLGLDRKKSRIKINPPAVIKGLIDPMTH